MDKYYIPKDKFDVKALEKCWEDLCEECTTGTFDYDGFCEVTKLTYELFNEYGVKDTVPKEILFLFSKMYCYAENENEIDELYAFSKKIITQMLHTFSQTLDRNNEILVRIGEYTEEEAKTKFPMMYKDKPVDLDVETFEFREFVG